MQTFIILSAPPANGKSTWANKYLAKHPNTKIISSDEIRFELTGQYQDFSKQKDVWQLVEKRIEEYRLLPSKPDVIVDALTDLDEIRVRYLNLAKNYDRKILVILYKNLDDMKRFNQSRPKEKWVPEEILEQLYKKFELPSEEVIDKFDEYKFYHNFYFDEVE